MNTNTRGTWSLGQIAEASGRPRETVWKICRMGLLPARFLSEDGRTPARIPQDVAEALVFLFSSRVPSPDLARLMRSDPARAREALDALALVLTEVEVEVPAA